MSVSDRPVLVTGAAGCIGAWIAAALVRRGTPVVAFDRSGDRRRLRLLLDEDALARVAWHQGDIADLDALEAVAADHDVGAIVHLAALQVPFCKADPAGGARINVVGLVNVLEVARRRGLRHLVYASSIAALPAPGEAQPSTLYGVYKAADEAIARVYWQDWAVPSIGLRPHTVYGLGRDQGLTAAPTEAMLAAAAGRAYTIPFSGRLLFQYAGDVAESFVRCAAAEVEGAPVYDIGGSSVTVEEIAAAIRRVADGARIEVRGGPLPFPHERDEAPLRALIGETARTPLEDGVAETVAAFRALLTRGLLAEEDAQPMTQHQGGR